MQETKSKIFTEAENAYLWAKIDDRHPCIISLEEKNQIKFHTKEKPISTAAISEVIQDM